MMHRALAVLVLVSGVLAGCQPYSYKERGVPSPVEMSAQLTTLFAKTKQLCFGRYVLEVPLESRLVWGFQDVPEKIEVRENDALLLKQAAENFRNRVLAKDETAEITYFGAGPSSNSIQITYFDNDVGKRYKAQQGYSFIASGKHLFEWGGTIANRSLIPKLRARDSDTVPTTPGICIDLGFIPDDSGSFQEIVSAGIYMPSMPDVSFSVLSHKHASLSGEHNLIASILSQKLLLGLKYPDLTTLRQGKRTVGIWKGEESLVRRKDGTHDFAWKVIGQERSTLHPAVLEAKMYTKVRANRIGAADQASLTDDEAIAVWDKLLDSLRFRVNAVPTITDPPPTAHSRDICPRTGRWRATVPAGHRDEAFVKSGPTVHVERGAQLPRYGLDDPADEAKVVWVWQGDY